MSIRVIFFQEDVKNVPILRWLDTLPEKVLVKCIHRIERLEQLGHQLRRPEADYLRDGIYELRVRHLTRNYRMLYFFHGKDAVVISHGIVKESAVPPIDINKAIQRMKMFVLDPTHYSTKGSVL